MGVKGYTSLVVTCDLSVCAMEDVFRYGLPKPPIYTLYVSPYEAAYAKGLLKKMHGASKDNPFTPYINLVVEPLLKDHEWVLELGDVRVGSDGP